MLKKLIYFTLLCTFSHSLKCMGMDDSHSIQYLDKTPEDLFSLSTKFSTEEINGYEEDFNAEADEQLRSAKEQFEDYSLTTDLIPQIVRMVTRPALQASLKILELTKDEDTLLYLGRSPSMLHSVGGYLASLLERNPEQHIQVNYSGSANIPSSRHNDLYNVLTEERLSHFCRYLDIKGFDKLTPENKLYIIDQVGKGGGMNAFLRILTHYYTRYKKMETTPNVTLLLMNFNDQDVHLEKGYYSYNPKTTDFIFSSLNDQNKGFRSIKVKAVALNMPEGQNGPLDAMDDELVQQYLLPTRPYPACCWTEKYDVYRDSTPELAPVFTKALMETCRSILNKK